MCISIGDKSAKKINSKSVLQQVVLFQSLASQSPRGMKCNFYHHGNRSPLPVTWRPPLFPAATLSLSAAPRAHYYRCMCQATTLPPLVPFRSDRNTSVSVKRVAHTVLFNAESFSAFYKPRWVCCVCEGSPFSQQWRQLRYLPPPDPVPSLSAVRLSMSARATATCRTSERARTAWFGKTHVHFFISVVTSVVTVFIFSLGFVHSTGSGSSVAFFSERLRELFTHFLEHFLGKLTAYFLFVIQGCHAQTIGDVLYNALHRKSKLLVLFFRARFVPRGCVSFLRRFLWFLFSSV